MTVDDIIQTLDSINNHQHSKKLILNYFLEDLRSELQNSSYDFVRSAYFRYSGSSYERTVVKHNVDFDIQLILKEHFRADKFQMETFPEPGVCKLKIREENSYFPDYRRWITKNGHLRAAVLKKCIFRE
ncbi:hypothetical protein SK128_008588 [Halocaridina rubra]|uniref:Nucleotidyltransferase n=1 Tax=Halocaridina rubra TaxID=373956 RepID=A0AAN8X5L6_HALRR